jgi:hypothetical protein
MANTWPIHAYSIAQAGITGGVAPNRTPRRNLMVNLTGNDHHALADIEVRVRMMKLMVNDPGHDEDVATYSSGVMASAHSIVAAARQGDEFGNGQLFRAARAITTLRGRVQNPPGRRASAALQRAAADLETARAHLMEVVLQRGAWAANIQITPYNAAGTLYIKCDILLATRIALENFPARALPVTMNRLLDEATACGVRPVDDDPAVYPDELCQGVVRPTKQTWADVLLHHVQRSGSNGAFFVYIGHRMWARRSVGEVALEDIRARYTALGALGVLDREVHRTHVVHVLLEQLAENVRWGADNVPIRDTLPTAEIILDALCSGQFEFRRVWNNRAERLTKLREIQMMFIDAPGHGAGVLCYAQPPFRGRSTASYRGDSRYGLAIWWPGDWRAQ